MYCVCMCAFNLCCFNLLGERRIRVHTLALPVGVQPAHIYAGLNIQVMALVLANMSTTYFCCYVQTLNVFLCPCRC